MDEEDLRRASSDTVSGTASIKPLSGDKAMMSYGRSQHSTSPSSLPRRLNEENDLKEEDEEEEKEEEDRCSN